MTQRKKPEDLRSHRWLGVSDLHSFGHRSRLRQIGYDADDWTGKQSLQQLQQFCAGTFLPSEGQFRRFARRVGY